LSQLSDGLFFRPVITVSQYKTLFGVTYPTARLDLKKLEQAGIVQPLEGLDTITYYCSSIYRINEDIDAVLRGAVLGGCAVQDTRRDLILRRASVLSSFWECCHIAETRT
jgi:hypothetical protein